MRAGVGVRGWRRLRANHGWVNRAVPACLLVGLLGMASATYAAGDAGEHTFFQEQVESQSPPASQPAPSYAPLTIRRSPSRDIFRPRRTAPAAAARAPSRPSSLAALPETPATAPGPQIRPTLYMDRTLRKGDVVMFKKGLRVFAGSAQFPYTDKDFVELDKAKDVKKQYASQLQAIADNQQRH